LLPQTGAGVPALPKPREDESPSSAAAKARTALDVDTETQASWNTASEAFAHWREAVQDRGVYVFLFRMGKDSIRGFSLWDEHAPIIAVNTWWRVEARTFTLMHEYGHLLTRTSSACVEDGVKRKRWNEGDPVERWCERFAAAVLIPKTDLFAFLSSRSFWNGKSITSLDDASEIASHFHISLRASVIRLIEEGAATWDLYRSISPASDHKIPRRGGRGQTRTELRAVKYGATVAHLLRDAVRRDLMSYDDALSYLNVSEPEFDALTSGRG
jgi:Zn-dependent peptidase ImmA (M78 family)